MDIEALFGPLEADNDNLRICPVCDGVVTGRASKVYCCSACQRKGEYLRRDFAAEKAAALAKAQEQECGRCGVLFRGIAKDKKPLRFCSKECSGKAMMGRLIVENIINNGAKEISFSVYRPLCPHCGSRFTAYGNQKFCSGTCAGASRLDKVITAANDNAPILNCKECDIAFTPLYGDKRSVFCSGPCCARHNKRVRKARKRAAGSGVQVERVNPFCVFERDKWRCQLCGVKTPRKLRGTLNSNAPELDHIQPLALGGEHSYRNTQCACRSCNGAKGAKWLGQMRLFG